MAETPIDPSAIPATAPASASPLAFDTASLEGTATAAGSQETNVEEYGFDDESINKYEFEILRARKGDVFRIGLLTLPLGARVHYKKPVGYFQCMSTWKTVVQQGKKSEICSHRRICCDHAESTRKRFVVPVIIYNTLPDGRLAQQFGYTLKAWVYSDDKYATMRQINSEFPLLEHDLHLRCEEENFQRFQITPLKAALIKQPNMPDEVKNNVKQWVETNRPKMGRLLGKQFKTDQDLLVKLGVLAAPTTVAPQMDAPAIDVAQLLES